MVTHLKNGEDQFVGVGQSCMSILRPLIFPVVTLCDFKRKTCFVLLFTAACSGGNRNVWRRWWRRRRRRRKRRRRRCRARNVKKKWFCPPFVQTPMWETWQKSRVFIVSSNRSSLRYSVPVEEATFLIFTHTMVHRATRVALNHYNMSNEWWVTPESDTREWHQKVTTENNTREWHQRAL